MQRVTCSRTSPRGATLKQEFINSRHPNQEHKHAAIIYENKNNMVWWDGRTVVNTIPMLPPRFLSYYIVKRAVTHLNSTVAANRLRNIATIHRRHDVLVLNIRKSAWRDNTSMKLEEEEEEEENNNNNNKKKKPTNRKVMIS